MKAQRAPFSEDLIPLRTQLRDLMPVLQGEPDWYASIYFERKAAKTFSANLRQSQIADQVSMGIVLRIYDGYTLFEEASDELDAAKLKGLAQALVKRVRAASRPTGTPRRPYRAPSWKERLSANLDPEITAQIPAYTEPGTPVHFGIQFERDPYAENDSQRLERLRALVQQCKTLAPSEGLKPEELTFILARQGLAREESIFIDSETNMSQTLFRLALTLITMSGADRTYQRIGGLGGQEAVDVPESEIRELLRNLKALKSADRLSPGKYKVLFGPVLTGVLAHEAFGHAQEGDTCARGRSKAWDLHKSGQKVGNDLATILNNPAIFKNGDQPCAAWGSYFFDEEGWLASEQVLLNQGILTPPMTNLTSALRLGVPRSANGKRESWANGVYTRQTNTYFSAGTKTLSQLMAQIENGYLALHPAGGMEDPKGMGIQVGISFLQEIKAGKLTGKVLKGPAGGDIQMTGYTPDILNSILDKSKIEFDNPNPDRAKHPFNDAGGCGKYHKEFVHAGCGGPYLLLDQVILG